MKLVLPFPPSVNTYWRAPNKGPLKAAILSVRKAGHIRVRHAQRLLSSCVAFLNHHRHQLRWRSFSFPDARRRDIDNYNKALFDALTRWHLGG
jgi:crossover junction endodeoxyribonuclease RusA